MAAARPTTLSGTVIKPTSYRPLGVREVDDGIWLASFIHYDLGYFDLEDKTSQPLDNPFGTRLSPHVCCHLMS